MLEIFPGLYVDVLSNQGVFSPVHSEVGLGTL